MTLSRVRKRDGREVPFDENKIRAAIQAAMEAVDESDAAFAVEVAGIVRMTLETSHAAPTVRDGPRDKMGGRRAGATGVPTIEEIQDLVERALVELGRARVAKAYILHRDGRARAREALEVHGPTENRERSIQAVEPRVTESGGDAPTRPFSPWSKGRIVAALVREADLPRSTAEEVAARVEARVFQAALKRISTSLVRELVDNELVAMGLDVALKRQASVLLPVHDLRSLIGMPPAPLDDVRPAAAEALARGPVGARVAGEALRRFALDHVLDEPARERHQGGDLFVAGLESPHLWQWTALAGSAFGGADSQRESFALIDEMVRAAGATACGVVLCDPEEVLAPVAVRPDGLASWLVAAGAAARAAGRRLDLAVGRLAPQKSLRVARALIVAIGTEPGGPSSPRLLCDVDLLGALGPDRDLDEALDRGLARGSIVPTWSADREGRGAGERYVAPGCVRKRTDRAAVSCAGSIALNLPRLARRAGPWREDLLLEELAALVAAAIAAAEGLLAFQHSVPAARPDAARGRTTFALAPVGLREALRIVGDGEIRPDQGARVLGFLADAARRMGAHKDFDLNVEAFCDGAAPARFSAIDARERRASQPLLFGEAAPGHEPGLPYSAGFRLTPVPGCVPWEAEARLTSTVATGALWPLPEDASRGGVLSLAEATRRFGRLRREPPYDLAPLHISSSTTAPAEAAPDLFASKH